MLRLRHDLTPWKPAEILLLEAARKRGSKIGARRVIVCHHAQMYMGPDYQGRELPKQGEELVLARRWPGARSKGGSAGGV